ncbi:MAG: valine--tRNA ligase [Parvimonas sp.]|uniref:valine--tRNA ligase n=1 Tax=Parvimonas sp. TaxID=1944660 RepID=UPI0025D7DAB9|nr:valine--tRNA ligase [Parvimonas sp.]MCI5996930.1 valine--tRNA ligase [Parvimonas sp.]
MKNLEKTYNPKDFEKKIYDSWIKDEDFTAHPNPNKEPYTIVMPPPNVTGNLHLGHALNNTIQDILIRWKRMSGYEALWIPGTDHASISTEAKVVEKIKKDGNSKEILGRDGFLKEAWNWTDKYGGNIKNQLKTLGVSCDWSRDAFTLDENLSKAVEEVFIKMYKDGLIYRGDRIVNWCCNCGTAISDAEVDHIDEDGNFYHIKYFFKDSDEYIVIATTRPETMLGDLAVAVHPNDDRYKEKVGKTLVLPLVDIEIPLISDEYVDMEFGTGCVKITPSHDPNDFEVGGRHNLGQKLIMDYTGKIAEGFGRYSGMDRTVARKEIVNDLREKGYLVKIEPHSHAVGHCERCKTTIEPIISKQWFVKMEELAKPAKEAYLSGKLKFVPDRFGKVYMNWLNNIKDWCISRQLWWGHRLPVYYCNETGEVVVSREEPKVEGKTFRRDDDTLDTWFSSALWPFSTLGWPNETQDLKYFFPTNVLVTGYDIIFFWVIRMVFSSLYNLGEIPFTNVYFTGLIRDELGRKMSKSLNNGIDPIEVIEKYGADALRFTLISGNTPGNDMRFYEKRVEANRNFANKLWNASRFVLMNLNDDEKYNIDIQNLENEDKWILTRLSRTTKELTENLEKFEFGLASAKIYDFIWNEFCDWYIEFSKTRLYGDNLEKKLVCKSVLVYVLNNILKLLHPFMPFITEEIYSFLPENTEKLINASFPVYDKNFVFDYEEKEVENLIEMVTAIRNKRSEKNIPPSKKSDLYFVSSDDTTKESTKTLEHLYRFLASCSNVIVMDKDEEISNSMVVICNNQKVYIPLDGLVDYEKELEKLMADLQKYDAEIKRASSKLANEKFVNNAPQKVVDEEKEKLLKYKNIYNEIKLSIEKIKNI